MPLPPDYSIRLMRPTDYAAISEICRVVYPHDEPYTAAELAEHHAVYPQGQFVAEHAPTGRPSGCISPFACAWPTFTSTTHGTC